MRPETILVQARRDEAGQADDIGADLRGAVSRIFWGGTMTPEVDVTS